MKPTFGPFAAWSCTVISIFAVIILCFLGLLFSTGNESLLGSVNDPDDGSAAAKTLFITAIVYAVFMGFCSFQIHLNKRTGQIRV